jgi:hypothetical protein
MQLGMELRDNGQSLVLSHTSEEWRDSALRAIQTLALRGLAFGAEDVRKIVGNPERPNAMGAVFGIAAKSGLIQPVGFVKAERAERHASRQMLWVGR